MRKFQSYDHVRLVLFLDFDWTSIRGDMTEPLLASQGVSHEEFWAATNVLTISGVNPLAAYARQFMQYCPSIVEGDLISVGEQLELVGGLPDALSDARAVVGSAGIELAIVVLTSGFEQVVNASPIAAHIDACFGSTWHKDRDGRLVYPDRIVTADAKAKIMAGVSASGIPLLGIPPVLVPNLAFIADGYSDWPAFEFLADSGGRSLLVSDRNLSSEGGATEMASRDLGLCTAPLDYRPGSTAHRWIMTNLNQMAANTDVLTEVM